MKKIISLVCVLAIVTSVGIAEAGKKGCRKGKCSAQTCACGVNCQCGDNCNCK